MTVLEFLQAHQDNMLADLGQLVNRETPSTDKAALDDCAQALAEQAIAMDAEVEIIPSDDTGNLLTLRWGDGNASAPILLLAHFDTVWPMGTLDHMPFQVKDGIATGPGIFDMKAGLVQGLWAVRALHEVTGTNRSIVFLCTGDEEIGSPASRPVIEAEATRAQAVFVLEPSQRGALKTARKGVGRFHADVTGRPAHAGLDPRGGVSAIEELAHLILYLHALADPATGTTVNVGVVQGGTRSNVVAAEASAEIDLRITTQAEGERATGAICGYRPQCPGARVTITGGINRPPMERTKETVRLFQQAQRVARELGLGELGEVAVGGASDGNFCSAMGVPVLDGLGAVGGGAHALDEHVDIRAMAPRAALVARLLEIV
jgi:glutamate carboxypeptidase